MPDWTQQPVEYRPGSLEAADRMREAAVFERAAFGSERFQVLHPWSYELHMSLAAILDAGAEHVVSHTCEYPPGCTLCRALEHAANVILKGPPQ